MYGNGPRWHDGSYRGRFAHLSIVEIGGQAHGDAGEGVDEDEHRPRQQVVLGAGAGVVPLAAGYVVVVRERRAAVRKAP